MKSFPLHYAAIGLALTGAAVMPLISFPDASLSTYAAVIGVMLGAGYVTLMSWRNALPTDTVGQLLQRTESPEGHGAPRARTGSDRHSS